MRHIETEDSVSGQELEEFWRAWCLDRLQDQLKEEVAREYAENGFVRIVDFDPHDGVSWLRLALAL